MSTSEQTTRRCAKGFLLGAAVLVAVLGQAQARDFNAAAEYTYQRNDEDGELKFDSVQQQYLVSFRREISDPLSYRLQLNFEQTNAPLQAAGTKIVSRSVGPRLLLNYSLGAFSLNTNYSFHWGESSSSQGHSSETAHNLSLAAGYRISERTSATVLASRVVADSGSRSSTFDRFVQNLGYGSGKFALGQNLLVSRFTQSSGGFDRISATPGAALSYQDVFFGGKVIAGVTEGVTYNWMRERASFTGGTLDAPRALIPAVGLYVRAALPSDTSLNPLAPVGALVDHDLDVSAGIDLGPNGLSFNNLAVDMGRFAKVDQFEVYVRDASGRFVVSGGAVTWTAWSSVNGTQWTPIPATAFFDTTLSRYVVDLTPTDARYFKVVNFSVNLLQTFVTELVPLVHGSIGAGVTRVTSGLGSAAGVNLAATLREGINVSYSGTLANNAQSSPTSSLASWSQGHALGAVISPIEKVSLNANAQYGQTHVSGSPDLRSSGAALGVTYTPTRMATGGVNGSLSVQTYGPTRVSTEAGGATLTLIPIEALQLSASSSLGHTNADGQWSTSLTGTGSATARVRPELILSGVAIFSKNLAGGFDIPANVPISRVQRLESYSGGFSYQPSRQLFLTGHVGHFRAGNISGLSEGGTLGWVPFPDGPLTFRTSYAHDIDSTSGVVSRRLRLDAFWVLGQHLLMSGSYNDERSSRFAARHAIFLTFASRL